MGNMKEYLRIIKNAIFGKDMRGAIHDAINEMHNETSQNTTRQDLLEKKYDEQIKNIAGSEVQSAEVVDARCGFDTLGSVIKQKVYHFENVEKMKNCLTLLPDDVCETLGYYEANDGGEARYLIRLKADEDIEDGGSIHFVGNSLVAEIINNKDENYYDEITYTKERHYNTDCYIINIPKYDNDNNIINPYVGYSEDKTPTEYARENHTTLTINGNLWVGKTGAIISNGNILSNNEVQSLDDIYQYIGIKENREIVGYKANSTNANQMLNDGCVQAFLVYYKLIENGISINLSNKTISDGENEIIHVKHPRQCLGVKQDGTIIILTCDGRTNINAGLTSEELQNILLNKGCINAWNLDGGGSTSTTIRGSKINRNIDSNGTKDRMVNYTLNVKKTIINKGLAEVYSKIGKEKQNIIQQLIPYCNELNDMITMSENISNEDLNTLIGKLYIGYGNNCINRPVNENGYFINIPHAQEEHRKNYNKQFFLMRENDTIFIRTQKAGVFSSWTIVGNKNIGIKFTRELNRILANETYQNIKFTNIDVDGSYGQYFLSEEDFDTENQCYDAIQTLNRKRCTINFEGVLEVAKAGNKYFKITYDGATGDEIALSCITATKQETGSTFIPFSVQVFVEIPAGSKIRFKMYGSSNDAIHRGRISIESTH